MHSPIRISGQNALGHNKIAIFGWKKTPLKPYWKGEGQFYEKCFVDVLTVYDRCVLFRLLICGILMRN